MQPNPDEAWGGGAYLDINIQYNARMARARCCRTRCPARAWGKGIGRGTGRRVASGDPSYREYISTMPQAKCIPRYDVYA